MVKKEFKTLIQKDHEKVDILFITGKITGIAFAESGYEVGYSVEKCSQGYTLVKSFTPEQYDNFKKIVERFYPGLCIFNAY